MTPRNVLSLFFTLLLLAPLLSACVAVEAPPLGNVPPLPKELLHPEPTMKEE